MRPVSKESQAKSPSAHGERHHQWRVASKGHPLSRRCGRATGGSSPTENPGAKRQDQFGASLKTGDFAPALPLPTISCRRRIARSPVNGYRNGYRNGQRNALRNGLGDMAAEGVEPCKNSLPGGL
jgi:hypothetical protein